jgi:hypothetical protein
VLFSALLYTLVDSIYTKVASESTSNNVQWVIAAVTGIQKLAGSNLGSAPAIPSGFIPALHAKLLSE